MTQIIGSLWEQAETAVSYKKRVGNNATRKDYLRQLSVIIADRGAEMVIGKRHIRVRDADKLMSTVRLAMSNGLSTRFLRSIVIYNRGKVGVPVTFTWKTHQVILDWAKK